MVDGGRFASAPMWRQLTPFSRMAAMARPFAITPADSTCRRYAARSSTAGPSRSGWPSVQHFAHLAPLRTDLDLGLSPVRVYRGLRVDQSLGGRQVVSDRTCVIIWMVGLIELSTGSWFWSTFFLVVVAVVMCRAKVFPGLFSRLDDWIDKPEEIS